MARVALKGSGGSKAKGGGPGAKGKSPQHTGAGGATSGAGELLLPPPGTFDPGLAAQIRSSERGLDDAIEEARRSGKRERVAVLQKRREDLRSLHQSLADTGRARQYSTEDNQTAKDQLGINFSRSLEDLGTAKMRGQEDYDRTLTDLQHTYATRAVQQQEASVEQGTGEAGTAAASSAVRAANAGHDKGIIDLGHLRETQDLLRREGRLEQDFGRDSTRLQTEQDRQLAGFNIGEHRAHQATNTALRGLVHAAHQAREDRAIKLSHQKREQGIYATDVAEQAYYQAHKENPNVLFPSSHPAEPGPGVGNSHPVYGIAPAIGFNHVGPGEALSTRPTGYGY